jgi:hypothetical protein
MKKTTRITLIFSAPILLIGGLSLAFYIVLSSPEILTPVSEWGLSHLTQAPARLGRVAVLKHPFRIEFNQLRLNLNPKTPENYLEIDSGSIFLSLSGSFGKRILWVEKLALKNIQLNLNSDVELPKVLVPSSTKATPGLFGSLLSTLTFKKVGLKFAEVLHGRAIWYSKSRRVELSEIDLRFDQRSAQKEPVLNGNIILSTIDRQEKIDLPESLLDFTATLTPFQKKRIFSGQINLTADHVNIKGAELSDIKGRTLIEYDHEDGYLRIKTFELNSITETFSHESVQPILPCPVAVRLTAEVDFIKGRFDQVEWGVEVDNLGLLKGKMAGQWKDKAQYDVNIVQSWLALENISELVSKKTLGETNKFDIQQKVDLNGEVTLRPNRGQSRLSGKILLGLNNNQYRFQYNKAFLKGTLGGSLEISGNWPGSIGIAGHFESPSTDFFYSSYSLNAVRADVRFKGRYPEVQIEDLGVHVPLMKLPLSSQQHEVKNINIQVDRASLDLRSFSAQIPTVQIDSDLLRSVIIGINHTSSTTTVHINADKSGLIRTLNLLEFFPSDWKIAASDTLQADLVLDAKEKVLRWQTWLDLKDVTFEGMEHSVIAENVALTFKAHGNLVIDDLSLFGRFGLDFNSGEILFDRFYLNFQDRPLNLKAEVINTAATNNFKIRQGLLKLHKLAQVIFQAEYAQTTGQPGWNFHFVFPATDIAPLYDFVIKEPFEMDNPALAGTDVTGILQGSLDLIVKKDQWEVKGGCRLKDALVSLSEQNIIFEGLQLDLPLWIVSRLKDQKASPLNGKVFIGKMKVPFLAEQSLVFPLLVKPNHLSIPKKVSFKAATCGQIDLWPLELYFGKEKGLKVDTHLDVDNFKFDAGLSRWWPSQGPLTINASLDSITIDRQTLNSSGRVYTNVFGGNLQLFDPHVAGIFSSTPILGMDVMIERVNLSTLTDQTSFGKIDGILKGRVENLEIANREPQRFILQLETVSQRGVPQKISVEAVESIARIGGGQSPFMGLAGNFASLFKKFGYRKIGVTASLENDLFRVNGLVHENGREYLIKKSGLSGVDVVNSNPDNRIGFKDMIKRIKRVLDPHAKPVVQ